MPDASAPLLQDPMAVLAYLAAVLAGIFWVSRLRRLERVFRITPPIVYVYFLPTLSSAAGIIPLASPTYDWIRAYMLPLALLLLMVTVDLPAILRLGWMALVMMVAGTVGIIIGGPVALATFGQWLPPDTWKGFAALSGSWIGGGANMVAMAQSVGASDSMLGPVIVVDTVVGYGWMGVLLFLSAWQHRFDRWNRANRGAIDDATRRLSELQADTRPLDLPALGMILGVGMAGTVASVWVGGLLPPLGSPTIISHTTWAVLVVVTAGLALSFTPIRRLEAYGASVIGYLALYLLMASIGAQADIRAIFQTPMYLAAGALWIAIHVAVLLVVARLIRAPLFFVATGSMANVGGAASAPVVAGIYHPALAPVGLLMGVSGYILGIYGALICAWLLARVA